MMVLNHYQFQISVKKIGKQKKYGKECLLMVLGILIHNSVKYGKLKNYYIMSESKDKIHLKMKSLLVYWPMKIFKNK